MNFIIPASSRPGDLRLPIRSKEGKGSHHQRDGIVYKNLFASYVHLHALGTPEWAHGFVSLASKGEAIQSWGEPFERGALSLAHGGLDFEVLE